MATRRKKPPEPPAAPPESTRALLQSAVQTGEPDSLVELLQMVVNHSRQPGAELARLAAYEADNKLAQHAGLTLFAGLKEESVPEGVRRQLEGEARPVLEEALHQPAVSDERKLLLGPTFALCGGDLSREEYQSLFQDFQGATQQMLKKTSAALSDQPEAVQQLLGALEVADDEGRPGHAETFELAPSAILPLMQMNPAAGAAALGATAALAIEARVEPVGLSEALEELGQQRHERVAWYLGELSRWPAGAALTDKAAIAAAAIEAAGIKPRCVLLRDYSHGFVSMIDGAGSRSLNLFFRTPEGGMDALNLMLNDQVGLKDAWCAFEDSTEIERAIHGGAGDLVYAPCPLALARELVADAWALHVAQDRPLPGRWFVLRRYLGEEPILPRHRQPNLGAYMLEMLLPAATLAAESDELTEYGPYGGLWFAGDAAYEFIRAHRPRRGRRLNKANFETFVREVCLQERDLVLARMAVNLELEARAGRATQKINQLAARTYLVLTQQLAPFHEVPYVRALAEEAVPQIIDNLREGYKNQEEANRASLEMDQELDEMLDDLDLGNEDWEDENQRR